MTKPIALLVADIHLSETAPLARSAEPNWFAAMARQLRQLRALQEKYDIPIICAGDIFDKYRSSPALINFAIDELPKMYSIPGQHDLPNHRLEDIEKSAYTTLVKAGVLVDLGQRNLAVSDDLIVWPFPWGVDITGLERGFDGGGLFHLAVVHAYCYTAASGSYPGAPEDQTARKFQERLKGYDVAVFGDNHGRCSLPSDGNKPTIWNCGTFFRRKSDERKCRPCIGILYDSGEVKPHYMDVSEDKWLENDDVKILDSAEFNFDGFVRELDGLSPDTLDFKESLRQYMDHQNIDTEVRRLVEACCEEKMAARG